MSNVSIQRTHPRTKLRRRFALGALAVLMTSALAACAGGGGGPEPTGQGAEPDSVGVPRTGGEVVQVQAGVVATIDPAVNKTYSFSDGTVLTAIFGALSYEVAATGEVKYLMLKDMTSNDDFTVWTMHINPGIKFSDGTPFDAEAIKYNYERFAKPETASPLARVVGRFESMTVVDDLTLEIALKEPNSGFPHTIATNLTAIGSPKAFEEQGTNFAQHPVGAGPFKLKSLEPNQQIVVERNPYYSEFKPGQPYLDQITFQNLPDYSQQQNALAADEAQMANPNGAGAIDILRRSGQNVIVTPTSGGGTIMMNMLEPPFDDIRAREAIWLALDRSQAANAFAQGASPATNLFQETSPYFDKANDFPAQDTERAQELFDELAAEGKPVNFVFQTIASPQQAPFAAYLQAALSEFDNVSVEIRSVPAAQYSQDFRNGRYQMTPHGLYMVAPVPNAVDYFQTGGLNNTTGWDNPIVQKALANVLSSDPNDVATQKGYWDEVQQQLIKDFGVYVVNQGAVGFVYNTELVGENGIVPINYGVHPLYGEIGYRQ